jgi:methionyl-tRNA synthetase
MKNFYVTTPIYYVNAKPHLGHLYTTTIADLVARFKRQRGFDVFFLTGTDEHGQKIEQAANKRIPAISVKEHVDEIVAEYLDIFSRYGFSNDHWIRTTDDYHKEAVQEFFRRASQAGYIYKGYYEGWFCVGCAEFKEEEEPGKAPFCPLHDREAEKVSEESYFFKLSAFQEPLLKYYEEHPEFIRPESRRNEIINFVRSGLKDLSVSRVSVKWGITVSDDPGHTIYVWFDALSNYITALGWGNKSRSGFDKYWPADLQLVGKDILRFHTVYWPAFLMAIGVELPKTVYAHGMWISGGRKISKELGNVIDPNILLKFFSRDYVRYFSAREMVFGLDGDFTYEALVSRVNSDLAKGLGNLVSRTLKMVEKYCQSVLPVCPKAFTSDEVSQEWENAAKEVKETTLDRSKAFETEFNDYNFSRALEIVWEIISKVDKYISDSVPWNLAKDPANKEQLETVLYTSLESLRFITVILAPVMPDSTLSIWTQMGLSGAPSDLNPETLVWGELPSGSRINEVKALFPTLDKEKLMAEIQEEKKKMSDNSEVKPVENVAETQAVAEVVEVVKDPVLPLKPTINYEDFDKIDLRVAQVVEAERVPKADKLLRLVLDAGEGKPRQILAGIAQYYTPEEMVGRKIIIVANLEPKKLRGFESQGMLLAASIGEGKPIVASFLEDVPNGARLK